MSRSYSDITIQYFDIKALKVATDTELLDLTLKCDKQSKHIFLDVFTKDTDSCTYVLPSTCFPKNNMESIPKDFV